MYYHVERTTSIKKRQMASARDACPHNLYKNNIIIHTSACKYLTRTFYCVHLILRRVISSYNLFYGSRTDLRCIGIDVSDFSVHLYYIYSYTHDLRVYGSDDI
jgi:hypothetical protein